MYIYIPGVHVCLCACVALFIPADFQAHSAAPRNAAPVVCVCVRERERVRVCVRVCVYVRVCVCVCV